jgi:hypothetical protein
MADYWSCWTCKCPTKKNELDEAGNCKYCREEASMGDPPDHAPPGHRGGTNNPNRKPPSGGRSLDAAETSTAFKEEPDVTRKIGLLDECINKIEGMSKSVQKVLAKADTEPKKDRSYEHLYQTLNDRQSTINGQREEISDLKKEVESLRFNLAPPFPRFPYDPEGKWHRCEGCGCGSRTKNMKLVELEPKAKEGDWLHHRSEVYTFCSNKCVNSFLHGGGRQMTLGNRFSIYYKGDSEHFIEEYAGREAAPVVYDHRLAFVGREVVRWMLFSFGSVGIIVLMALSALASYFIF